MYCKKERSHPPEVQFNFSAILPFELTHMTKPNDTFDYVAFYRKLDKLLQLSPGSVQAQSALANFPNWDSLTILEFMVMVDADYSSDVQPADVAACKTVAELAAVTVAHSSRAAIN